MLTTKTPGPGPDGLAVLRLRASIWTAGNECSLAELYVVPQRRNSGLGRALMQAAMDLARTRGADYMDLGTSEHDHAALALYGKLGFTDREGGPTGRSCCTTSASRDARAVTREP